MTEIIRLVGGPNDGEEVAHSGGDYRYVHQFRMAELSPLPDPDDMPATGGDIAIYKRSGVTGTFHFLRLE